MEDKNNKTSCLEMSLDFLKDMDSVKGLDIIIDICDEIKYGKMDRDVAEQRFKKILYNLKNSKTFNSLLEGNDRKILNLFLEDFLKVNCDCNHYYIGNEDFAKLTLDEFYHFLMKIKYLKEKEVHNKKAVN